MEVQILKSKILRAFVTSAHRDYEGSLAIDTDLMERTGILPYEKILVGNIDNGERFETYAIPAPSGSHTISLNGAVAHLGEIGHRVVIMSFASMSPEEARTWKPEVIVIGKDNGEILRHDTANIGN